MRIIPPLFLLGVIAGGSPSLAQEVPHAFVGARLITISEPEIPDGVLVVHEGRIVAVGPTLATTIPSNAVRHESGGKIIMPGFVDTHSHVGSPEGGDHSGPLHPDVRVLDSINVRDARLQKAQAGGITTVNVMSGSGHLLSGQTVYLKLRDGGTIDDLALYRSDGQVAGGMKMANGTNSRRPPPFPTTRARSAAMVRAEFLKAQDYERRMQQADGSGLASDYAQRATTSFR